MQVNFCSLLRLFGASPPNMDGPEISEEAIRRRVYILDEVDSGIADPQELDERIDMYEALVACYKARNERMKVYLEKPLREMGPVSGNRLKSLYLKYKRHTSK
jgi:hypothetical protein